MATAERPPAKIDGKPNPAYQAWYRDLKKAAKKAAPSSVKAIETDFGTVLVVNPPKPGPEVLTLRVISAAPNPSYVFCDNKGVKVAVKIDRRMAKKVLKKSIPVKLEADGTYSHAP